MKNKIPLLLSGLILLFSTIGCDKSNPLVPDYGVSITAPTADKTSRFVFSTDELDLLRSSNGLAFMLMPHIDLDSDNVSSWFFSPLALAQGLSCYPYEDPALQDFTGLGRMPAEDLCHYYSEVVKIFQSINTLDFFFDISPVEHSEDTTRDTLIISQQVSLQGTLPLNTSMTLPFFEDNSMSIVDIPLEEGTFSMLIFKPTDSLQSFLKTFTERHFLEYYSRLSQHLVEIQGTPYHLHYAIELAPPLRKSGLGHLLPQHFAKDSLSDRLSPLPVKIRQQVSLDLSLEQESLKRKNEDKIVRGTTVFEIVPPYVFFIKEQSTNTILLSGICR